MSKTFIIAEAACTWLHGGLEAAFRSIRAAKECGADAWKTQWTSDPESMAMRRGVARDKYTRLGWAQDALPKLKEECERVGIEFMCTVFIPKDVMIIQEYVEKFKVSAFESEDEELFRAIGDRVFYASLNPGKLGPKPVLSESAILYCVSKYPTSLEQLGLSALGEYTLGGNAHPVMRYNGLSDHTTSVLTGAVAVGAGAKIIEKHVRLSDTPSSDPDYGHSLDLEMPGHFGFQAYVNNIREAERML